METAQAVNIFLALGQESRLRVFRHIVKHGDTGICPSQISEDLAIPPTTLSFHLKDLCQADLVSPTRAGRKLIYKPLADRVEELCDFLLEKCCNGKACLSPKRRVS